MVHKRLIPQIVLISDLRSKKAGPHNLMLNRKKATMDRPKTHSKLCIPHPSRQKNLPPLQKSVADDVHELKIAFIARKGPEVYKAASDKGLHCLTLRWVNNKSTSNDNRDTYLMLLL